MKGQDLMLLFHGPAKSRTGMPCFITAPPCVWPWLNVQSFLKPQIDISAWAKAMHWVVYGAFTGRYLCIRMIYFLLTYTITALGASQTVFVASRKRCQKYSPCYCFLLLNSHKADRCIHANIAPWMELILRAVGIELSSPVFLSLTLELFKIALWLEVRG